MNKSNKILAFLILVSIIAIPATVFAQTATSTALSPTGFEKFCNAKDGLASCIQKIYLLSLGLGAIVALLMIVLAGYRYMTAGGNAPQVEAAKDSIASAFIGLIIIFVAFILLSLINPDLVRFKNFDKTLELPAIPEVKVDK